MTIIVNIENSNGEGSDVAAQVREFDNGVFASQTLLEGGQSSDFTIHDSHSLSVSEVPSEATAVAEPTEDDLEEQDSAPVEGAGEPATIETEVVENADGETMFDPTAEVSDDAAEAALASDADDAAVFDPSILD